MQMDGGSKDYRLIPVTDSCATKVLCEFVAGGKHAVRKVNSHLTITHPRLVDTAGGQLFDPGLNRFENVLK
jgi:hypothetical protein